MNHQEFFDEHAHKWDKMCSEDMSPRLARVVAEADVRPGHRVLDVGSGTGVLIPHILEAVGGKGHILALDFSDKMLSVARGKGFPSNVKFLSADMQQASLSEGAFDRVLCNAALPHFSDKRQALAEMVRVLRPGGLLAISHPMGREAVHAIHREAGEVIAEDLVPAAAEMQKMMESAGLVEVRVIDEPDFHLAIGRKPPRSKPA